MGGMVALNAEETTSFAQFIAKTMRQSALQGWPEVETSLTQVLWTKHLQRSGFRALWSEVEGLMNDGNYQNNRDYYLMSYNTAPKIDPSACQGLVPAQSLVTLSDRIEGYDNGIFGFFLLGLQCYNKDQKFKDDCRSYKVRVVRPSFHIDQAVKSLLIFFPIPKMQNILSLILTFRFSIFPLAGTCFITNLPTYLSQYPHHHFHPPMLVAPPRPLPHLSTPPLPPLGPLLRALQPRFLLRETLPKEHRHPKTRPIHATH